MTLTERFSRKGPVKQIKAVVNEIEKKSGKGSLVVSVGTTPSMSSIEWDGSSLINIVETIASYYAMETDLFSEITPVELAYYLSMCCFAHFNQYGVSGATGNIPTSTKNLQWSVPYAFAKYLEYNSPYKHNDVAITNRFAFASSFFGTPGFDGLGYGTNVFSNRPNTFPFHQFFPMATLTSEGSATNPQILYFPKKTVGSNFTSFLTNEALIGDISSAIAKRGNTIKIGDVPGLAPDSSAYSRTVVPGDGVSGILSIDSNYDPELTLMMAPVLGANNYYNSSTRKSYPLPNFTFSSAGDGSGVDLLNLRVPDFYQISSVWVFLAQHTKDDYKPGRIRDVFAFEGQKLSTLYPTEQPDGGNALGEIVQAVHNQYVAAKQNSANEALDPENYYLTLEATVAYAGKQYRRNRVEVIHLQCPSTTEVTLTIDDKEVSFAVLQPQFFYVDASWASTQSPLAAAAISAAGPVVVDGKLRIPLANFQGYSTNLTNPIGPQLWSSVGLSDDQENVNNLTIPWGVRAAGSSPSPPDIIWDNSVQPNIVCDSTFVQNWYAFHANTGNLYPCYPTAGAATCIQDQFKTWLQAGAYSQTSPLAAIDSCDEGDLTSMTAGQTMNANDATLITAQTSGFGEGQDNINALIATTSTQTYPNPRTHVDAAFAGLTGLGNVDQYEPAPSTTHRYVLIKRAALAGLPFSSIPTSPPTVGAHSIDLPWSTGKAGLLSTLAQMFSSTTSPFFQELAKAQKSGKYNIVDLVKRYAAPTLKQSMQSIPVKHLPVGKFLNQSKSVTKKEPPAKKIMDFATNTVKSGLKDVGGALKQGFKDMGEDAIKSIGDIF
jgi:hypothetical protein